MTVSSREEDVWDSLCHFGLPLTPMHRVFVERSRRSLMGRIRKAARLAAQGRASPRENEALEALMLALKSHYPSVYERLAEDDGIRALVRDEPGGRIIKLARIARAVLGEYL